MRRLILILITAFVLLFAAWFFWPFLESPAAQVERQHKELIKLAGQRYWTEAKALLAEDYEDQWGSRRDDSIELARQVFSGFLALDLQWKTTEVSVNEPVAKVRGTVHIEGTGPSAQVINNEVNRLKEPWVFTWRKDGWKPSDWKLVSVKNAELEGIIPSELK